MRNPNVEKLTIEQARARQRQQRQRYLAGFVDPEGIVRTIVCIPDDEDTNNSLRRGAVPVELIEGRVMITHFGQTRGWQSLEQMCIDDKCPERYQEWRRVMAAREGGQHIEVPNEEAIYPPSLLELRRNKRARSTSVVYVAGKGNVDMKGMTAEQKKERAATLAAQLDSLPGERGDV